MGALRPVHILILVLVVMILFGWKKLPDAARSLGRSMRIFKSEVEEMKKDGKAPTSAASSDTVKGETIHSDDTAAGPITQPSEREKHDQPPV